MTFLILPPLKHDNDAMIIMDNFSDQMSMFGNITSIY